jgi:hypothetical protein
VPRQLGYGFRITHNEGLVVVFKLRKSAAGGVRGHGRADGPFIDSSGLVLLEQRWGNEWLEDKPATEVDAEGFVRCR